jgi:hypothetical protein
MRAVGRAARSAGAQQSCPVFIGHVFLLSVRPFFNTATYVQPCVFAWRPFAALCPLLHQHRMRPSTPRRPQVFQSQLDASYDYRADPTLHEACEGDANTICKGVKPGGGRIQACLVRGPRVVGRRAAGGRKRGAGTKSVAQIFRRRGGCVAGTVAPPPTFTAGLGCCGSAALASTVSLLTPPRPPTPPHP